jgi:hypothetical protein
MLCYMRNTRLHLREPDGKLQFDFTQGLFRSRVFVAGAVMQMLHIYLELHVKLPPLIDL